MHQLLWILCPCTFPPTVHFFHCRNETFWLLFASHLAFVVEVLLHCRCEVQTEVQFVLLLCCNLVCRCVTGGWCHAGWLAVTLSRLSGDAWILSQHWIITNHCTSHSIYLEWRVIKMWSWMVAFVHSQSWMFNVGSGIGVFATSIHLALLTGSFWIFKQSADSVQSVCCLFISNPDRKEKRGIFLATSTEEAPV